MPCSRIHEVKPATTSSGDTSNGAAVVEVGAVVVVVEGAVVDGTASSPPEQALTIDAATTAKSSGRITRWYRHSQAKRRGDHQVAPSLPLFNQMPSATPCLTERPLGWEVRFHPNEERLVAACPGEQERPPVLSARVSRQVDSHSPTHPAAVPSDARSDMGARGVSVPSVPTLVAPRHLYSLSPFQPYAHGRPGRPQLEGELASTPKH